MTRGLVLGEKRREGTKRETEESESKKGREIETRKREGWRGIWKERNREKRDEKRT